MENQDNSGRRFDRIEAKLDKLAEAITKIVRVEEQLANSNKLVGRLEERVTKMELDLNMVAGIARSNATVARFLDKLFWVLATAGIGFLLWLLQTKIGM